eukprot:6189670-Pleurochrysis_carterae.AAC.1
MQSLRGRCTKYAADVGDESNNGQAPRQPSHADCVRERHKRPGTHVPLSRHSSDWCLDSTSWKYRRAGSIGGFWVQSLQRHWVETLINAGVCLAIGYAWMRVRRPVAHPCCIWKRQCCHEVPLRTSILQCPVLMTRMSTNAAVDVRKVHGRERQEINANLFLSDVFNKANRRFEPESERASWICTYHLSRQVPHRLFTQKHCYLITRAQKLGEKHID